VANLSKRHLNPSLSNPKRLEDIPKSMVNDVQEDEILHDGDEMDLDGEEAEEDVPSKDTSWQGIRKEIGILTEIEFQTVMTKCLRAMGELKLIAMTCVRH
jgi:proteasome activator subunit 4